MPPVPFTRLLLPIVLGGVLSLFASALAGTPDVPRLTPADLQTLRQRLAAYLLAETSSDSSRESDLVRGYLTSLDEDGLWPDIDYSDRAPSAWKTETHLTRLEAMARAWRSPRSALRDDETLRTSILAALDAWLSHDYQNPNWWHNQISVPRSIGHILLLMGDAAGPERLRRATTILGRSDWETMLGTRRVHWTGANLVDMAQNRIMRGILEGNEDLVADAFDHAWGEIRVVAPGEEGIQADSSFHQHGSLLYDGGYGEVFTTTMARLLHLARETPFSAPGERRDTLVAYVLDGPQWMIRGRRYDYGILGRGITRTNRHAGGLLPALDLLAEVPGPRRAEVVAFAKRLRGKGAPLSGNRHFYRSDFMVHQRPGWYASARGFSTRTYNTDGAHNGEGIRSHHLADGANYLMRSGDEYADIFPVWDWRKVPGTTVAQSTAPFDVKTLLRKGETSFVGGVSDGTYGMAAMDLQRDGLTAQKAWFFFDDEYVCLGAGITDTSGFPVATTVDQRLLKGDVRAAGKSGPLSRSDRELRAGWVLHDGVGYLFPEGTPLHLSNEARTGHWSDIGTGPSAPVTKDVFTLWIDHGASPTGASYQYTVVPGATPRSLEARLRSSPVDVLSNTPDLQAVRHARLGITMAAFRAPGTVSCEDGSSVTVDRPCLLLMRRTGNRVCVAVSNPENAALAVIVTLRRDKDSEPHTLLFDLPGGPVAGRSVIKEIDLGR